MKTSDLIDQALDWAVTRIQHPEYPADVTVEYSTEWEYGGPIIERERTEFDFNEDTQMFHAYDGVFSGVGPTHLVAAMRCFVASKLGDEVDIPEELL
ncbi:MAG: hypothetical protein RL299_26 [Pseudomonadota bacterium]